jgi:hypothetical protein
MLRAVGKVHGSDPSWAIEDVEAMHKRSSWQARMAAVLGTTAQYWLNLQNAVDLYDAQVRLATSEKRPRPMPVFG